MNTSGKGKQEESEVMQKGAFSREQFFQENLKEQQMLQDCIQTRKESLDISIPPPTMTPPNGSLLNHQNNRISQISLNPALSFLSPLNFLGSEVTQHYKLSGTSFAAACNQVQLNSQSKQTTLATPNERKYNSLQVIRNSLKSEEEDSKFFRPFPSNDEESDHTEKYVTQGKLSVRPGFGKKLNDTSFSMVSFPQLSNANISPIGESPKEEQSRSSAKADGAVRKQSESADSKKEDMKRSTSKGSLQKKQTRQSAAWNTSPILRASGPAFEFLRNMNIMKHIKLFLSKLKSYTITYNFNELRPKHFDMIADPCSFYNPKMTHQTGEISPRKIMKQITLGGQLVKSETLNIQQLQNSNSLIANNQRRKYKIKKSTDIFLNLLNKIPVFDPNSWFFIIWDIFILLIQMAIFFLVPLNLSFEIQLGFLFFETKDIQQIEAIIFILDLIITLNRGVYLSGSVTLDRKVIIKEYIQKMLITDIITFISLASSNKYSQCLILIRLKNVGVISHRLDDHFQIRMRFPIQTQLMSMISSIILVAHFCSCLLYLVSRLSVEYGNEQESLLSTDQFVNASWKGRYINCLYMTLITMSTVGYGDITPKNYYEKSYTMVMTMISSSTFGYVVNTVGQIFLDIEQRRAIFNQKKFDVTTYMNARGIPKYMQIKTIKYLEYTQLQNKNSHTKGEVIIDSLPLQLISEIKQEFFGKILKAQKIFKSNFSNDAIQQIALKMKEIALVPGQYLFQGGQKDYRVYFLLQGGLSVFISGQNGSLLKIQSISEKNTLIGQRSFFCEQIRTKWVKCEKSANLAYIELKDFKEALLHFPQEYETFCQMRDIFLFDGKTADTPCASCGKFVHNFSECPLIHLKLNKLKVIFSFLYSVPQVRQKPQLMNRIKKNFSALNDLHFIKSKLRKVRVDKIVQQLRNIEGNPIDLSQDNNESLLNQSVLIKKEIESYENLLNVSNDKKFYLGIPDIIFLDELNSQIDALGQGEKGNEENEQTDSSSSSSNSSSSSSSQSSSSSHSNSSSQSKSKSPSSVNSIEQDKKLQAKIKNCVEPIPEIFEENMTLNERTSSPTNKTDEFNQHRNKHISNTSKKLSSEDGHLDFRKQIQQIKEDYQSRANSLLSVHSKNDKETIIDQSRKVSSSSIRNIKDKENNNSTSNNTSISFGNTASLQAPLQFQNATNPNNTNANNSNVINSSINNNGGSLVQQNQYLTADQILKVIQQTLQNNTLNQASHLPPPINSALHHPPSASNPPQRAPRKSILFSLGNKFDQKRMSNITQSQDKNKFISIKQQSVLQHSNGTDQVESQGIKSTVFISQHMESPHFDSEELYYYDFETQKKMIKYFPRYNMQNVLLSCNKVQKQRIFIQRKSIRFDQSIIGGLSIEKINSKNSPKRRRDKNRKTTIISAVPFQRNTQTRQISFLAPLTPSSNN